MTRLEKRLTVGLVISGGVNLLIIGFIAAMAIGFQRGHVPDFTVDMMAKHLSPEARDVLKETLSARKDDLRTNFKAMRQARRNVVEVMTADEFDRAAVETAFAEVRAVQDRIHILVQQMVIDTAAQLPHEDRVQLARMGERILRHAIGGGRRHGRHGPGHHGPRRHGPGMFGPPEGAEPPEEQ